jgi:hypothetical protein
MASTKHWVVFANAPGRFKRNLGRRGDLNGMTFRSESVEEEEVVVRKDPRGG